MRMVFHVTTGYGTAALKIQELMLPDTYIEGYHNASMVKKMEYRVLGDTGLAVSKLGFGVSALGSVFRPTIDSEGMAVVEAAVKAGINWFDAAPWYGHGKGETVFGRALVSKRIPREAIYVSTKVGRYLPEVDKMFDFRAERVIQSVDESLQRMGLDYVDLIQIHDMEFAPSLDIILSETLPALQKVKESGKAKFIGITGYPLENFRTILEKSTVKIDTVMTYCHFCLNDTSLADYLSYFKEKGVGVLNASPNGMGLLTHRGPPDWHPAMDDIKSSCKQAADYCKTQGVDISRLAVHFTCANPDIPTTLVSTASTKNFETNFKAACEALTPKEQSCLNFVLETYFKPLKNKTWEGVEVRKYKEKLWRKKNERDSLEILDEIINS
eukprot:gene13937-4892_t